ncbi:hypothetical protein LZ30DRAFT_440582 [Colletotrichum cereale]|nr:hypothetical protein LZ30DRAFT_440582 [Colletotrichum cereale]
MSTPNRSLPGRGESECHSSFSGSGAPTQSAPPSGLSHLQRSDRAPSEAPSHQTQQEAIRSLLFTDHEQFEALSPEIQQNVLSAFDWLLFSQETQDSLEAKRRAKQAEADWLAKAICSVAEADQDAVDFLQRVLLRNDNKRDSPGLGSDTY